MTPCDSWKLLICTIARHRGEHLVRIAKKAGASGATLTMGRSVQGGPLMRLLSLADVHQDLAFMLLGKEKDAVCQAIRKAALLDPKKYEGTALIVNITDVFIHSSGIDCPETHQAPATRRTHMESGYTLVTVIINHGYADDVMAVAREAGAFGGTILNARGTGTAEDARFFGITLVPEKEVLMLLVEKDKYEDIVAAIKTIPQLSEPGVGIIYSLNVEEFLQLGK